MRGPQAGLVTETMPADPRSRLRGPKAQRSAKTRAKLLDATIACLHDVGYDRTTTVLVVERAGVARGSLLHQFPTKVDLMIGAIEHIAGLRRRAHEEGLKDAPSGPERLERMIEILWEQLSSPSGIARLEILLASRGDADLSARLAPLETQLQASHHRLMWLYAERLGIADRGLIEAMTQLYTATLRGLSVDALFPSSREHVVSALALLNQCMMRLLKAAMPPGR
jgi:AcrR family transcriptional regulator